MQNLKITDAVAKKLKLTSMASIAERLNIAS